MMEIGKIDTNTNAMNIPDPAVAPVQPIKNSAIEGQKVANGQAQNQQAQDGKEKKSENNMGEAVDKLNKAAAVFDRSLKFQIHKKTHTTMVSVIDTATDKVIRQIPNEEVLDMVSKMEDYLGLIFDKKA